MKTSGTLQSIGSIARSQSANDSQVRFNRFTGKAIVMGSSGSRFGLVSWVRKLYTTSSNKKVQRFLMDGIAREHRNDENLRSYLQKNLVDRAPTLWTVSDIKLWDEGYTSSIEKKAHLDRVLSQVRVLVDEFLKNSGRFESCVSLEGSDLLASVPGEEMKMYRVAGLTAIADQSGWNLQQQANFAALTKFSGDTRESDGSENSAEKDLARDFFNPFLSAALVSRLVRDRNTLQSSAKNRSEVEFPLSWQFLVVNNKDGYVQVLLDTHCGNGGSGHVESRKLFHQKLQDDKILQKKVLTRLAAKYVEHNKDFTKTIFIDKTFLKYLPSGYVGKDERSAALDAVLLQELDQIFADYQSEEPS